MKVRLIAQARTGKTKFIELEAIQNKLYTRWGYTDGEVQETVETCEAKNVGKANEITAEEQAVVQLKRKMQKKIDEGYVESKKGLTTPVSLVIPNFANLQKSFAPCKPIADTPSNCLDGSYVAERKFNGVNLIVTKDADCHVHVYTRRIEDITDHFTGYKEFSEIFEQLASNSLILGELIYREMQGEILVKEDPEQLRGLINSRRKLEDVQKHYQTITKNGEVFLAIFDVLFWENVFVGKLSFTKRREILYKAFPSNAIHNLGKFDQAMIENGRRLKWEGFVLRKPDSTITYTMNGKPDRAGSYKWKFEVTDDFIVTDAIYGKGKHEKYFARFHIAQYDDNGALVDCGYCGPGNLTYEQLVALHKERSNTDGSYKVDPYMVIEVLYRTRTKDAKLEFPVFQRIRDDKKAEDCIYEYGN
jgi:ATP-dependent DNA ligase